MSDSTAYCLSEQEPARRAQNISAPRLARRKRSRTWATSQLLSDPARVPA
jgi:hypothetical protein